MPSYLTAARPVTLPKAILDLDVLVGGMGVEVSSLELVTAVARHPSGRMSGSLSATALADVYTRRLQLGDPDGAIQEAFAAFVKLVPALAADVERLTRAYLIPGGKAPDAPFKALNIGGMTPPRDIQILTIVSTFAHVWRAKKMAPGRPVGVNFLRKIERPLLFGLYGAVLGGADWVVMGAGDPSQIPGFLRRLARHEVTELPLQVATVPLGQYKVRFDPRELVGPALAEMPTPAFLAILSSHLQAQGLAAKDETRPDGFVIEGPSAGGHNAPPAKKVRDEKGNYIYGPEDEADLAAVAAIGLPYWAAGGRAQPRPLSTERGPGRQVGTLFALSAESGMEPSLKRRALELIWRQRLEVVSGANSSPSGYAFKVAMVPGTLGDPEVYAKRERVCNLGHLRGLRPKGDAVVGLCPADDTPIYTGSGGAAWRVQGAMCLCNGLMAACGLGQPGEPAVLTLGEIAPVRELQRKLRRMDYTAAQAADYLIGL
ncbi:nitronate monooxygenase [bacterium]|nr:MAG: nitronate monooxygenase [bacterium]